MICVSRKVMGKVFYIMSIKCCRLVASIYIKLIQVNVAD